MNPQRRLATCLPAQVNNDRNDIIHRGVAVCIFCMSLYVEYMHGKLSAGASLVCMQLSHCSVDMQLFQYTGRSQSGCLLPFKCSPSSILVVPVYVVLSQTGHCVGMRWPNPVVS